MIFKSNIIMILSSLPWDIKLITIYLSYVKFKYVISRLVVVARRATYLTWRNVSLVSVNALSKELTLISTPTYRFLSNNTSKTLIIKRVYVSFKAAENLSYLSLHHLKHPKYLVYTYFNLIYVSNLYRLSYFYNINFKKLYKTLSIVDWSSLTLTSSTTTLKPLTTYLTTYV